MGLDNRRIQVRIIEFVVYARFNISVLITFFPWSECVCSRMPDRFHWNRNGRGTTCSIALRIVENRHSCRIRVEFHAQSLDGMTLSIPLAHGVTELVCSSIFIAKSIWPFVQFLFELWYEFIVKLLLSSFTVRFHVLMYRTSLFKLFPGGPVGAHHVTSLVKHRCNHFGNSRVFRMADWQFGSNEARLHWRIESL